MPRLSPRLHLMVMRRHYDHSKLGNVLSAINNLKVDGKHIVIGCTVSTSVTRVRSFTAAFIRCCRPTRPKSVASSFRTARTRR